MHKINELQVKFYPGLSHGQPPSNSPLTGGELNQLLPCQGEVGRGLVLMDNLGLKQHNCMAHP